MPTTFASGVVRESNPPLAKVHPNPKTSKKVEQTGMFFSVKDCLSPL